MVLLMFTTSLSNVKKPTLFEQKVQYQTIALDQSVLDNS
jgi:hypothetical protein